ncbi:ABC transporter permease [Spiribacter vilamensis]|uniref:NitT/TauT family transport system permease protein n=1 Tax=Spiribacter vilamensis TaxID=531306 RepID=A0A4Q8D1D9_9GAMM|nr:ABC transporter permease subunit [Spiribacter vilamensis]RZU99201.1 NitT/TauT family transport system permease protein [Spiribacter vilamensis]TVO61810.1 ABC transporter permease subunit [Spiribacter vilamensis]
MKRLINQKPTKTLAVAVAAAPFLLAVGFYVVASVERLAENPNDKLLPSLGTLAASVDRLTTEPSRRTGDILLWADTQASLFRIGSGVAISMVSALLVGVLTGLIPYVNRTLSTFIAAVAMIPPLAVLPIFFIAFGVGELSKIMLIIFGILPVMIRDLQQRVEGLPSEQLVKAQTLGASSWQVFLRVAIPQTLPRLFDVTRLALGSAWLFLIAAEAIAAEQGLGYRIFLVRRYLDMQTIIPYVVWITILAFLFDWLLRHINQWLFPWYTAGRSE